MEKSCPAATAGLGEELFMPAWAPMLCPNPRRARKEPLSTMSFDRDYSFRMSTFWSWRIHLCLFFELVSCIILPFRWMCDRFAPSRSIREPRPNLSLSFFEDDRGYMDYPFRKRTPEYVERIAWSERMMLLIFVMVEGWYMIKDACWIEDAWSTAIMFCPYILQGRLKHIKSHIFGKPRMVPTETIAAFGSSSTGSGRFIMDSGATSHFVGNASMLQDIIYFPLEQRQLVTLADGFCLPIVGIGTLLFTGLSECGSYTRSYRVPNVRYVRGLAMNVISVGQLDNEHGLCSAFHSEKCEIMADRTVIGQAILVNRLYEVVYLHVPRVS